MKRVLLLALTAAFLVVIALGYAFEADNLEREVAQLDKAIDDWPENEGKPQPYLGEDEAVTVNVVARQWWITTGRPVDYRPTTAARITLIGYHVSRSATLQHLVALRRWTLLAVGVVLFGSIAAYVLAFKPRRSRPDAVPGPPA